MKKGLLLIALCFALSSWSHAQTVSSGKEDARKPLSGEVYLGIGAPLYSVGATGGTPRYMAGLELRYRLPQSGWDFGIGSRVGVFKRFYSAGYPVYLSSEHYLVADYNWRINTNLVFFAGVEGGISVAYDMSHYNSTANAHGMPGVATDPSAFYTAKSVSPYIAPRIGIEAWNHLRCTLGCDLSDKGNSNLNFRVGYVF